MLERAWRRVDDVHRRPTSGAAAAPPASPCRTRRGAWRSPRAACARDCCSRASSRHPRSSAAATAPWCAGRWRSPAPFNARSSVKRCVSGSCGLPQELPNGKSLNRKRGTPVCSTMSLAAAHDHRGDAIALPFGRPNSRSGGRPGQVDHQERGIDPGPPRQRARISGASVSKVTRWLRLVGAPWKRLAIVSKRPWARELDASAAAGTRCRNPWPSCACGRSRYGRCACHGRTASVAGIDRVDLAPGVVGRPRTLVALVGLIGRRRRDQRPGVLVGGFFFSGWERGIDVVRPAIGICRSPRRGSTRGCGACTSSGASKSGAKLGGVGHGGKLALRRREVKPAR